MALWDILLLEARVGQYSVASDLYALGGLWAELESGKHPSDLMPLDLDINPLLVLRYTLQDAHDDSLFQRLVHVDPRKRPRSVEEVICYLQDRVEKKIISLPGSATDKAVTELPLVASSDHSSFSSREDWNFPDKSLSQVILDILFSEGKNYLPEVVLHCIDYVRDGEFDLREQFILSVVTPMLHSRLSSNSIDVSLKDLERQFPEHIFGLTRSELKNLYETPCMYQHDNDRYPCLSSDISHSGFRSMIEHAYRGSLPVRTLISLFKTTREHSRANYTGLNQEKYAEYLQCIRCGELDERVADLEKKMRYDDSTKSDPHFYAICFTLEDEGFIFPRASKGDRFTENTFRFNPSLTVCQLIPQKNLIDSL